MISNGILVERKSDIYHMVCDSQIPPHNNNEDDDEHNAEHLFIGAIFSVWRQSSRLVLLRMHVPFVRHTSRAWLNEPHCPLTVTGYGTRSGLVDLKRRLRINNKAHFRPNIGRVSVAVPVPYTGLQVGGIHRSSTDCHNTRRTSMM